jgi:hypothetical protein
LALPYNYKPIDQIDKTASEEFRPVENVRGVILSARVITDDTDAKARARDLAAAFAENAAARDAGRILPHEQVAAFYHSGAPIAARKFPL